MIVFREDSLAGRLLALAEDLRKQQRISRAEAALIREIATHPELPISFRGAVAMMVEDPPRPVA